MKGDTVIVRAQGNAPAITRVWEADSNSAWVCSDAIYEKLLVGESERNPVWFPREDIFCYDERVWRDWKTGKVNDTSLLWKRLVVWKEDERGDSKGKEN